MNDDVELSRLAFRVFGEICKHRRRKVVCYDRLNKVPLILDMDHSRDVTQIGVFGVNDTPKTIYEGLEKGFQCLLIGARIPSSLGKYSAFIRNNLDLS